MQTGAPCGPPAVCIAGLQGELVFCSLPLMPSWSVGLTRCEIQAPESSHPNLLVPALEFVLILILSFKAGLHKPFCFPLFSLEKSHKEAF